MHSFFKIALLGFMCSAMAFDLEDYATKYEVRRTTYLEAANALKLATGPYKAARDAYVAATATYTKSLYERRRLGEAPNLEQLKVFQDAYWKAGSSSSALDTAEAIDKLMSSVRTPGRKLDHGSMLEDFAATYRDTRDAYLEAANALKMATGPYKAARDAYVAASATYTKSLYERRRLMNLDNLSLDDLEKLGENPDLIFMNSRKLNSENLLRHFLKSSYKSATTISSQYQNVPDDNCADKGVKDPDCMVFPDYQQPGLDGGSSWGGESSDGVCNEVMTCWCVGIKSTGSDVERSIVGIRNGPLGGKDSIDSCMGTSDVLKAMDQFLYEYWGGGNHLDVDFSGLNWSKMYEDGYLSEGWFLSGEK